MNGARRQFTTFYIDQDLYGIDVTRVQEVTGNPRVVPVPLAPDFVEGMVNLRGQIATALRLRALFGHGERPAGESMSVVCRLDGSLVSLLVDVIGDVVEVDTRQFEAPLASQSGGIGRFLEGVCKMDGALMSIVDLEKLSQEMNGNPSEKRRTA